MSEEMYTLVLSATEIYKTVMFHAKQLIEAL